ncbi:Endonuclease/exonuclease/phosphatase, partial [Mycena epipterygia]
MSLNMKGNGHTNVYHNDNKWYHIWQLVREAKAAVTILTEAHPNEERKKEIDSLFGRVIRLEYTEHPQNSNAKGIAIVLNKNMIETSGITTREVVPGRAMILEMKNVDGTPLSILAVYAPNAPGENATFWKTIQKYYEDNDVRHPDVMGGDFNMVESAIDRLPAHIDTNGPVETMDNLKTYLGLIDGWRETYPTTRAYTYHQTEAQGGSQSRIDRILVKRDVYEHTYEWDMQSVGIQTDHRMVSMKMTTAAAPTIGHGRWVWPAHLMRDKILTEYIHERGMILQAQLDDLERRQSQGDARYIENNAQTMWMGYKIAIGDKARERAKIIVPKITQSIAELELRLKNVLDDTEESDESRKLSSAPIIEELTKLQMKRYKSNRLSAQARNRLEGEIIGRYWSMINKKQKPRDVIHRLKKEGTGIDEPITYETDSKRMATMARNHHNKLQSERTDIPAEARQEKIETVLNRTKTKTTEAQNEMLRAKLTLDNVREALKLSANNKAPGLDGITYEVWKTLDARYQTAVSLDKPAFNIMKTLLRVYNDIETHGMIKGTGFSKSWMCPLYKKNDKADIANYRPISLLNTDYKIFTKALTVKL